MAITMFSLPALLAPLQSFFMRPQREPSTFARCNVDARPAVLRMQGRAPRPARRPHVPLRVIRPQGEAVARARLVISGTMADVCAELDRLAALEQPAH